MSANIYEKMFYSFKEEAWHAIRKASQVAKTAVGVIKEDCFGAFTLENRPVTVTLNGVPTETGDFAIVRCASVADPNEIVFDYCTERYHPLQPIEVAETFDDNVCQPVETLAFLGKGEQMFISWKMPEFEVVADDVIRMYGIVRTGFDTKHGTKLFTSNVRPVCWNTITMAEGWAKAHTDKDTNTGMIWTGKGVNRNLRRDLGYWMEHVQSKAMIEADNVRSFFGKLVAKPIKNDTEVWNLLNKAYPKYDKDASNFPWQLRSEQEEKGNEINEGRDEIRNGIFYLWGAGTQITPDCYGLLNATSEYFCHYQPSKKPVAESIMFGSRAKNIMAMAETLNQYVK